jgi:DNA-cytosine methyltransferase
VLPLRKSPELLIRWGAMSPKSKSRSAGKSLSHFSTFSGVGGIDLGMQAAGWHTVAFCENAAYQSAILNRQWPGIPNFGDITSISTEKTGEPWQSATLWSAGFPCQDLSSAGKRKGFDGERSVLAFSFLNLVEAFGPEWILLENVPGLLTSNAGRDMGRLLQEMDELGYGVAWRTIDASSVGSCELHGRRRPVPQPRRRVFLLGHRGTARAGEVLLDAGGSNELPWAFGREDRLWGQERLYAGPAPSDPGHHRPAAIDFAKVDYTGDGTFNGVAGRAHTRPRIPTSSRQAHQLVELPHSEGGDIRLYRKSERSQRDGFFERWAEDGSFSTLTAFSSSGVFGQHLLRSGACVEHPLLDRNNESTRADACGNGVVSQVAEWIGLRIVENMRLHGEI